MADINWNCLPFAQLDNQTLYAILRLRSEVFVVEQDCIFLDMDGCDQQALHLYGITTEGLIAYARLLPPGVKYPAASIGRVVTSPIVRGSGYGREVMKQAILQCEEFWPGAGISIAAQQRLEQFYKSFNFITMTETYMEDGIAHIDMILQRGDVANSGE